MEYDIQLFEVNRAAYRRTRSVIMVVVPTVCIFNCLYIAVPTICACTEDEPAVEAGSCVVQGPLSCFSTVCEELGLICHVDHQCVCPEFAATCNISAVPTGGLMGDWCPSGNYTFAPPQTFVSLMRWGEGGGGPQSFVGLVVVVVLAVLAVVCVCACVCV